ncbi:MAG: nucleoside monophosphate kinase [Candidatus Saccharimonadales bacterium]
MNMQKIEIIKQWLGSGSINFFGPPFSGKDTQAKRIAEAVGGIVVSGGDILRHSQDDPELQRIMAEGGVVPPGMFLRIVPAFFSHNEIAGKPLLLSSVGRLMDEVPVIESATNESNHPIKAVIVLELSRDDVFRHYEISKNLGDRGQRADDTPEALNKRLNEYAKTEPVIAYYREHNHVLEIDDTKTPDEVTTEIVDALYNLATLN